MIRPVSMAALCLAATAGQAHAACDLSQAVGYTLVAVKTVEAYIEDGKRVPGFGGCTRDRVLVFTDNTGVRCKATGRQTGALPRAFLFAKSPNDLKLCVGDDMYEVAPAN